MSLILTGTFDGKVILLDSQPDLEANTKVSVTLEPLPPPAGFLATARRLQVKGPPDWASNAHRYLHGPLAADD